MQRLQIAPLLPEARSALMHLVASDWLSAHLPRSGGRVPAVVSCIYTTLSGMPAHAVQPFLDAWLTLYTALIHLDHLQDEDSNNGIAAIAHTPAAQYNLVFAYYVLAMALLDDLDPARIPVARQLRLLHRWNTSMLTTASGQQRDVASNGFNGRPLSLEHYEQAIQAKAGAIYGLAFGGAAILATDAEAAITALTQIGVAYGVLLQWKDDLLDAPQQPAVPLTLPNRYAAASQQAAVDLPPHTVRDYWHFLYHRTHMVLRPTIDSLPNAIQTALLHLLTDTFGPVPERA